MELTTAVLCDFAQVREGLLFISSGGITRLFRDEMPAGMGVRLALVIELDTVEAESLHEIKVVILDSEDGVVAEVTGAFSAANPLLETGERLQLPIAMDLSPVGIEKHGRYDLRVYLDSNLARTLRFYAVPSIPQGTPG
jgi:hypothetical protein